MVEPFVVSPCNSLPGVFVGSGYEIERADPTRHARQVALISKAFGFDQIAVRAKGSGTLVLEADGATYHVSGSYAGGVWHFALSRRRLGLDVIDPCAAPASLSDLGPLLDPALPAAEAGRPVGVAIPPYLLQLCAAEAMGKMMHVGLDKDILRAALLSKKDGVSGVREHVELADGCRVRLCDVSPLLRQGARPLQLFGVLAALPG
jgi:hypothetical protein